MVAEVTTYGGGTTVKHWQLHIDGEFIVDSSTPEDGAFYRRIAAALNDPPIVQAPLAIVLRGLMEECRNRVGWDWENDHWLKEGRRVLSEAGWPDLAIDVKGKSAT